MRQPAQTSRTDSGQLRDALSITAPEDTTETTLHIEPLDGGTLVLPGFGLAHSFFRLDPSSIGVGAYDLLAGKGNPHMIEVADIEAINRTMRARSKHDLWGAITGVDLPWLAAATADLDLILASDEEWAAADGDAVVGAALAAACGPGRGVSVATKMLHLKRPRLFPVLDELVVEMLGGSIPEQAEKRAAAALPVVLHLRAQGRANVAQLKRIQGLLAAEGIERTLVRVLDAILWVAHPAAGVEGIRREFSTRLR